MTQARDELSNVELDVSFIPANLQLIGTSGTQGDYWKPWPVNIYGTVYSKEIPTVQNRVARRCTISFPTQLIIQAIDPKLSATKNVHALLFQKGYTWDAHTGWRTTRISEADIVKLQQDWLFDDTDEE